MPKKRTQNFKPIVTNPPPKAVASSSRTVNERLAQLRAEQAPRPTIEQRNEIVTIATAHTLPPHLRRILNLPETPPIGPKPGARRLLRINGRRLPPGPAAPQSWLAASLYAPADVKARDKKRRANRLTLRDRPTGFSRLAILGEVHELPQPGTLLDQTLKVMAVNWDFISEYEQLNLGTLPIRWKAALLSYLSFYGPEEGIAATDLKRLFVTEDELPGGTGSDDLSRLDLTGLLTEQFTIEKLEKLLYRKLDPAKTVPNALQKLSLEPSTRPTSIQEPTSQCTMAESWEDETALKLCPAIKTPRFPNLTRLSLANAGRHASWSALLSLFTHLATITHLSLAHWPPPTTTPNSKTTFITHNHASIPVSGTHFYSQLDEDWAEAANVLKRLSNATYRLQWLDFEGCSAWIEALSWDSGDATPDRWVDRTFRRTNIDYSSSVENTPTHALRNPGPDWTGSWAQVSYVNISQGSIPRNVNAVRAHPASVIATELLLWLRDEEVVAETGDREATPHPVDVPNWLQREKVARNVAATIRMMRRSVGGRFCEFDHGWTRPVAAAAVVLGKGKKDGGAPLM